MITIVANGVMGLLVVGMAIFNLLPFQLPPGYNAVGVGALVVITQLLLANRVGALHRSRWVFPALVLCIICGWFVIMYFLSERTSYGLWKLRGFLLFGVMPSCCILLNYGKRLLEVGWLFGFIVVYALLSVPIVYEASTDLTGSAKWNLIQSGIDVIAVGRNLGAGLLIVIAYLLFVKVRYWLLAVIPVFVGYIYIVNERGPVMATFVSICLLIYMKLKFSKTNRGSGLMTYAVVSLLMFGGAGIIYYLMPRFSVENMAVDGRVYLLAAGWQTFLVDPFMGLGLGGFGASGYGVGDRQYVHNFFGEIVTETGLIGLSLAMIYLALVYKGIRRGFLVMREIRDPGVRFVWMTSCSLFIYYLLASQVSGDLVTNATVWVTGALVIVVASSLPAGQVVFNRRL